MIEIVERTSADYRNRVWPGDRMIAGRPYRAIIGEAGRLATPSRLASHTGSMNERAIVIRWVELDTLRMQRSSWPRVALAALRWRSLIASLFPIGLALATAEPAFAVGAGRLALAIAALITAQAAVNLVSEAVEHVRGDDSLLRSGGSKVLQRGWLTPRQLVIAGVLLGAAAAVTGVLAIRASGDWRLFAIGAVAVIAAAEIQLPPLALSHTVFGELVAAIVFGPLLTWATARFLGPCDDLLAIVIGIVPALAIALRRHVRNLRRLPDDRMLGNRTLVTRLGFERSRRWIPRLSICLALAPLVLVATTAVPPSFAVLVLATPVLVWAIRPALSASAPHHPRLATSSRRIDLVMLAYAALALGLATSTIVHA